MTGRLPLLLRAALGLALLSAAVVALPAGAAAVGITGPSAYGVVRFGQQLQVELTGACATTVSKVRVRFGTAVVDGRAARGCFPVVTVPTDHQVAARGFRTGMPVAVSLLAGTATQPLVFWRQQPAKPDLATVTDPFERLSGATLSTGDTLDLGRVDLHGIQSVNVRNLTSSIGQWELRFGSPSGQAIAKSQLGSAGSNASAGAAGWYHSVAPLELRPSQLGELNTFGDLTPATGPAPHLYLAIVAVAGSTIVNFVDLDGPGVGLPHRFGAEPGFTTLFDGSSFDGWQHTGPGHFVLKDGAMRAEHELYDRGWAWEWYSLAQYSDFVLRLRFKVEDYEDNGGILLRHSDPLGDVNRATNSGDELQIQEGFENLTGGAAHTNDAFRLATGMVGQWNDVEIVAKGSLYVFRINGVEVNRFHTTKQTRGFLSVENEQLAGTKGGHIWYDDIRVHRCLPEEPVCATS
jgi:hypothetical protein